MPISVPINVPIISLVISELFIAPDLFSMATKYNMLEKYPINVVVKGTDTKKYIIYIYNLFILSFYIIFLYNLIYIILFNKL